VRYLTFIATALLAVGSTASASVLAGDTVNETYYFPDASTVYQNLGNVVAPGAISGAAGIYSLQINDTTITASNFAYASTWTPTSFNGFVLTDESNSPFTGVTVDPATNMAGFSASNVTFTPNQILVNWQGLSFNTSTIVTLDLNGASPTPEPGFMWCGLIVAGVLAIVKLRRVAEQRRTAA